jgi:uncharacterized membrane protein YbhN (UPF0104 family)
MSPKSARRVIKTVMGALGVLVFLYLVKRIGLGPLASNLERFGPWFIATFMVAQTWLFCQSLAWWIIQKTYFQKLPLGTLFRIRVIGDSFNLILPSANLGGDALRAFMIRGDVPLKDGVPSVLFDKTMEFVGSLVFLIGGLLVGLFALRLPAKLVIPVSVSLGVTAVMVALFVLAQKRGLMATLTQLGRISPKIAAWAAKRESSLQGIDKSFRLLYTRSNTMAFLPLALQIVSRLLGVAEVMIIMAVLKVPIGFIKALFISTVITAGNTAFFVLPGQWGVTEGLSVLVLQSLGYPAAAGLSLAVIRRIRKLLTTGLGLILFAAEKRKPPRAEAP